VSPGRAVFLDRDGTLTRSLFRQGKPIAPASVADFELLPGVVEAVKRLDEAGFVLIVVTNQPDVGAGSTGKDSVEEMNRRLRQWLPLDDVRVCYHVEAEQCDCRKPRPGMLLAAASEWSVDLKKSWMVGDRWRDVSAGVAAGCRTVFIDGGYGESLPEAADFNVKEFSEAVGIILMHG
jgi:D-glycero-D-manno-heptose 1,7-bisphosphate phosphatase